MGFSASKHRISLLAFALKQKQHKDGSVKTLQITVVLLKTWVIYFCVWVQKKLLALKLLS